MIDEGETDWKIVCIDRNDALADQLNDISDVEKVMKGYLEATRDWFRIYKFPTGKPMNEFAFDGKILLSFGFKANIWTINRLLKRTRVFIHR